MTQTVDIPRERRPLLLDLFCCTGGALMGYHRAGFTVHGVNIVHRPWYPFAFRQGDALTVLTRALAEAVAA
ncbi:hypothetical protein [Streptomyces sp. NBC_00047]|uniref:hypothetical protein n=1 Tax=Streptomyces sp. NBC_00047 TaxID=2975627 RepID=UPI002B1D9912|nr:hypothetical protein [Streptomyces sp. NBC_00047]